MTLKQKQALLAYLGYYDGPLDGLWGEQSRQATKDFQQAEGLTADGDFGDATLAAAKDAVANDRFKTAASAGTGGRGETDDFWADIKYFTREEFRCQCKGQYCNGFPAEPDETMVRTVDEIRRRLGVPVEIVTAGGSGVRCPTHNANVGGVYNSEHLYGRAADLHSSVSPARMKEVAEAVMGNTGGIGLYSWGIHVDTGKYSRWNV